MAVLPPVPFKVKAIAAYTPSSATELPLVVGQIYEVTSTDGKGVWVQSKVNGVVGWFPFSYTQVIPNEPAAAAPPPQQSRPMTSSSNTATPATPAATATPAASTPATQVKPAAAPKVEKKEKPTKPGPALKTHIEKNKANLPTTVLVHVVKAKLNVPDNEIPKLKTSAFIFTRDVMGDDEGKKFEATECLKATGEPHFNESFKMVITDAELQTIIVRVVSGKEYNKKKVLGEFQILLRGSHRGEFEGEGSYKWHYMCKDAVKETPKKENATGKLLLYIQYTDTRETSKPTNFQRVGHIGWSASGGFDLNNIPPEWKETFKSMGISKAALAADQNLAKEVFSIMENHAGDPAPAAPQQNYQQSSYQQPQQAAPVGGGPAPPPPPPAGVKKAPPPTPMAAAPHSGAGASAGYQEQAPPPPPEEDDNPLLAAIRKGTSLRTVSVGERNSAPPPPAEEGLGGLLKKAMAGRLQAAGGANDWDEDEPADDDWD